MPTPESNALKWLVAGVLVCVFLAIDFTTPLVMGFHDEVSAAIVIGICIGQVNLIAAWAALAPGNIALRLPWSMLLGVFMWYALVLGNRLESSYFTLLDAVTLGIVLLIGVLAAQLPLWIARKVFRWRLVGSAAEAIELTEGPVQFYIWHLLAGMFFLAIALGPMRIVLPPGDFRGFTPDSTTFVLISAIILCSFVITTPCIWGAFLKRAAIGPTVFGWCAYCGLLTAFEIGVLIAILGPPGGGNAFGVFLLVNLSQCFTVFGTLLIFRGIGFQLIRVPKPASWQA